MLWGISFFNYGDRQAVFAVFPLLEKELHLSTVQLGLLGSSFALTYGICGIFAGAIVDRVRRVSAVLWGLYVWSLICVATAASRTFGQLLGFRAAEGLGETLYFPASMS
ncbi:MAG TPA: MFS transporter, partial [Bryobacteraceae bacterium]